MIDMEDSSVLKEISEVNVEYSMVDKEDPVIITKELMYKYLLSQSISKWARKEVRGPQL